MISDHRQNLEIADLAAGTCWVGSVLSKIKNISNIHCVDISEHRLKLLAPPTVKILKGDEKKIRRYLGSFYNLKFQNNSMDYVFLSQAFHHAEFSLTLFQECKRILKPNGKIILIGEHYIDESKYLKGMLKHLLRNKKFSLDPVVLFPEDKILGDHYYLKYQYKFIFKQFGFTFNYHYNKEYNRVMYYGTKQE